MGDMVSLSANVQEGGDMPKVIDDLVQEVSEDLTVMDGAITFIKGVPDLVQAAIDKALANGATEAQLAPVTQVVTELQAKRQALQDALAANVPADRLKAARGR